MSGDLLQNLPRNEFLGVRSGAGCIFLLSCSSKGSVSFGSNVVDGRLAPVKKDIVLSGFQNVCDSVSIRLDAPSNGEVVFNRGPGLLA